MLEWLLVTMFIFAMAWYPCCCGTSTSTSSTSTTSTSTSSSSSLTSSTSTSSHSSLSSEEIPPEPPISSSTSSTSESGENEGGDQCTGFCAPETQPGKVRVTLRNITTRVGAGQYCDTCEELNGTQILDITVPGNSCTYQYELFTSDDDRYIIEYYMFTNYSVLNIYSYCTPLDQFGLVLSLKRIHGNPLEINPLFNCTHMDYTFTYADMIYDNFGTVTGCDFTSIIADIFHM